MPELSTIPVITAGGCASNLRTAANAIPVLNEIRHALQRLAEKGESTTIDLSAIPFGPGDKDQLFEILGTGEVSASVTPCQMGISEISETRFPGVWRVRHLGPTDEELAVHIHITRVPDLLLTPQEDIQDSAAALGNEISNIEESS
ncbi:MAG: hydrogenase expression/formation C-terminal domain-containing protein [Gammaproteobacteria bacterium]